jgi:hypothetical protein
MGVGSKLRLLIIDEFSFLSQAHLAAISKRCQQASGDDTQPFGSFHVLLVGDARQHEPPGSAALVKGAAVEESMDGTGAGTRRVTTCAVHEYVGREAFKSFDRVVILTEQQRANDSPAGRELQRFTSLFMGDCTAPPSEIEAFCEALNAKTVTSIDALLPLKPRVVTQRQKARAAINFTLSLRTAAALGKRACVWLSQHTSGGATTPEPIQRILRKQLNTRACQRLPSALVFWEVRFGGTRQVHDKIAYKRRLLTPAHILNTKLRIVVLVVAGRAVRAYGQCCHRCGRGLQRDGHGPSHTFGPARAAR